MSRKRALRIAPLPALLERDPAACLRHASEYLAQGGLADAARLTALAAQIIEQQKRAH